MSDYPSHLEYRKAINKVTKANRKYPGRITVHEVLNLIKESNFTCFWCGKQDLSGRDLTIDHVEPINDIKQIVISCLRCNILREYSDYPAKLTPEEKREKRRIYQRKWYSLNKGYMRKWYSLNREKWNNYLRAYRSRK